MTLKPVRNYRNLYNRRTCSQCKHWNAVYGTDSYGDPAHEGYKCGREGGPEGEWNAIEPEFRVCDRFNWRDPQADEGVAR